MKKLNRTDKTDVDPQADRTPFGQHSASGEDIAAINSALRSDFQINPVIIISRHIKTLRQYALDAAASLRLSVQST